MPRQRHGGAATLDEVGVFGRTLFERQSRPADTLISLFGRLDLEAAEMLDQEQLVEAMASGREVRLDVTGLTEAQPEALRLFLARQHSGHQLAQLLAIRINAAQVPDLYPEESSTTTMGGDGLEPPTPCL
jgi:hypothetical protein